MSESQSVVIEAGFQTVKELKKVLEGAGMAAEIVSPPGCDPNG